MNMQTPNYESQRLNALYEYKILDSQREEAYDNITELASQLCDCHFAFISFIDKERQWLKSSFHIPQEYREGPRELSFCTRTIEQTDTVVIEDTLLHDIYKDHPQVLGEPYIRFYCGIPIINQDGYALGTLCVMDQKPSTMSALKLSYLDRLAKLVLAQIELNKNLKTLNQLNEKQALATEKTQALILNILPKKIMRELKQHGSVEPHYFESASVVFAKLINSEFALQRQPAIMLRRLDQFFNILDDLTRAFSIEKIKTNGNQFMAAAGIPNIDRSHAMKSCLSALSILKFMEKAERNSQVQVGEKVNLEAGIAIHSGSVIAGVVGSQKFSYDLWGDSVNTAARILECTDAGEIHVSEITYHLCQAYFEFDDIGHMEVKNMPPIHIFRLQRIKAQYAYDPQGNLANEDFMKLLDTL